MKWQISLFAMVLILIFFPSCFRVSMKKEFSAVRRKIQLRTDHALEVKPLDELVAEQELFENRQEKLSRADAIAMGLENNPGVQAQLLNLGLSKSDVVQAGLLSNPNINAAGFFWNDIDFSQFNPFTQEIGHPFGTQTTFILDDLWKKPFATAVACNQLKVIMSQLEQFIISVRRDIQVAYNQCMLTKGRYELSKAFVEQLESMFKILNKQKEEGKIKDIGIYVGCQILGSEKNRRDVAEATLYAVYAQLRTLIGMFVEPDPVSLEESLFDFKPTLPDLPGLLDNAVPLHPLVLAAEFNIEVAEKNLSLQRASILPLVGFGAVTDSSALGINNFGPNLELVVPLFDANQAQIARAHYQVEQAYKNLFSVKRDISNAIISAYFDLKANLAKLKNFEEILEPNFNKGIRYVVENSSEYTSNGRNLNLVVLLDNINKFYDKKMEYLDVQKDTLDKYAILEYAAARNINTLEVYGKNEALQLLS